MKRRQFTKEEKLQVVKEIVQTGNISVVARRHDIRNSVVGRWFGKYKQRGEAGFNGDVAVPARREAAEVRAVASENERLKRLLGEKELENAILKDLLKKTDRGWPKS